MRAMDEQGICDQVIKILRPKKAAEKIGVGRSTLYILIARGELHPIQLGPRSVGLYEHELNAWLAARPRTTFAAR